MARWGASQRRGGRSYGLLPALVAGVAIGCLAPGIVAAEPGVLEFGPQFYTSGIVESGVMTVVVTRSGGTDGTLSAQVVVVGGSATADVDYAFTIATVTFAEGDATPRLVSLTVVDDAAFEAPETVALDLVNPSAGTTFGRSRPAVVTILSDDAQEPPPGLSIVITSPLLVVAPSPVPVATHSASQALMAVSGLVQTSASASLSSISWRSDRGFSGTASHTEQDGTSQFRRWQASEIPLLAGANTLDFTAFSLERVPTVVVLIVLVSEYDYVLAEGATGDFFDTDIIVANPGLSDAPVDLTFLRGDGRTVQLHDTIASGARRRYEVDSVPGLDVPDGFSTIVTSRHAVPLTVERTTRWDRDAPAHIPREPPKESRRPGTSLKVRRATSRPFCCWRTMTRHPIERGSTG